MAVQYIIADEKDFSLGIDARSTENLIAPGFVQDLLNADIVEKRPRKRQGLQGFAGNLPARVTGLEYDDATNQICFTLDSALSLADTTVNLGAVRSSPIVVYGRSSSIAPGSGPFSTSGDTVRYYSGFTVPTRKTFSATSSAPPYETISIPATEHGISTTNLFVGIVESTSTVDQSYTLVEAQSIEVNETSDDLTVSYQNSTGTDKQVFAFYKDETPVTGNSYVATLVHGGAGAQTFTVAAGTHGLNNFNIIYQLQEDTGAQREIVQPNTFSIQSNGDVTVTITDTTAHTYYLILQAAPVLNVKTGNIAGNSTMTFQITDLTSPWVFYNIYQELTPGGTLENVTPDSVVYDDSTQTATVTITNSSGGALNFTTYYDYGVIRSNQLCVTDVSVTANATDTSPQLTIWGLDQSEIYGPMRSGRSGWSNHIDSYRAAGEQRLISGIGGNLFSARTYAEAAASYDYPLLYPNLLLRTDAATVLGPLFWNTSELPGRSRGYITSTDSGTNWAEVTAVQFDSGNGWTRYTISLPAKAILDSSGSPTVLASVISTGSGLEDWLTVQDMSYRKHNGTFRIKQIQDGSDVIDLWVENDSVDSSDYDDLHTGGEAGVFTDQLTWTTDSTLIPGDLLNSDTIGSSLILSVLSSDTDTSVLDGLTEELQVAAGILTPFTRTSSVIPMRSSAYQTSSTTNVVRGDMLSYTEIDRLLRVLYINSDTDRTVTITASSGTATATLGSGDTAYLRVGGKVLLLQAGVYTGVQTITGLVASTQFTFDSDETDTVSSATLAGHTVEIDEELTWEDTTSNANYFFTPERWIPIEAPDDNYTQTPSTHVRYFDTEAYGNEQPIRSTMVQSTLYLTNDEDEVYKFDGVNNYRAGLFPWQPGLFLTQNTAGGISKVVIQNRTVAFSASSAAGGYVTIASADQLVLPVGTVVHVTGTTGSYTVTEINEDTTTPANSYIYFDRALTGVSGTGTVAEVAVFRYYFRLNAIDANNNIVASAVTGYQDHVVELVADAAINLLLVGLPPWDVYDYDRLEVEVYRTKQNTSAPFYKVITRQMIFNNTRGYMTYTDSLSDSDLISLDVVSTALKGQELGTAWQEPLRAKYVTSIGNNLVLGNLRDYPQLDIQLIASGAVTNTTYAGKKFTFRRNSAGTGTVTDMVNTAVYEFINGFTNNAGTFFNLAAANTFNFVATGLPGTTVVGDWIYLTYSSVATVGRDLALSGWWQIAALTGTTVTINQVGVADNGVYPDKYVVATDPTNIPVLLGTDGNMGMVNGDSFDLFDTMRRMSMAINATMRMVDISITGMTSFTPWLVARGGNDVGKAGRLIVRQPRADSLTPAVLLPSSFSGGGLSFEAFVNDLRQQPSSVVAAVTRIYPSRLIVSYENYPEIFDNPTSVLDSESDSAVDVNSADGQEITGILPFFGQTAFTAAQQTNVLVAFKTNSIYLVDINEKRNGRNPIQRIETEGLGCTAPYSIAVTKQGIMFANESGIYCLRRDLTIQYIGRYMERNWTERVDRDQLDLVQGHHYGVGRAYKLSVPLLGDTENSEVYVYNHTGEDLGIQQLGAWGRYDSHPATGWANLGQDAYMASSTGRVFSIRRLGDTTDYRDDNQAITFRLRSRPNDYGNSGIRKVLDRVIAKYRTIARNLSTVLRLSVDLSSEYRDTTPIIIPKPLESTGMDDVPSQAIYSVVHTADRRKGIYFSIEIENAGIDESIEVAGLDCRIGGLTTQGITSAAQTANK